MGAWHFVGLGTTTQVLFRGDTHVFTYTDFPLVRLCERGILGNITVIVWGEDTLFLWWFWSYGTLRLGKRSIGGCTSFGNIIGYLHKDSVIHSFTNAAGIRVWFCKELWVAGSVDPTIN
jgi:hypothetical protein